MDKTTLVGRREVGALARRMQREGATAAEIAIAIGEVESMVRSWIDWANEYVPDETDEIPTARQAEIAKVNKQQAILEGLWGAIPDDKRTLHDFKLFNREFIELSKARRALGGLDAPVRVESKVDPNWDSTQDEGSIDAEVKRLSEKLGLFDGR